MSDLQNRVTELVATITEYTTKLTDAKKELAGLTAGLKDQLKTVNTLVGNKNTGGSKAGRPKGSVPADGELSISKQVLNFLAAQESGATRHDILTAIPNHEAAVQAAIRVHQQNKKIVNKDHRWHYVVPAPTTDGATGEPLQTELPAA